jgi:hypothetical protein
LEFIRFENSTASEPDTSLTTWPTCCGICGLALSTPARMEMSERISAGVMTHLLR